MEIQIRYAVRAELARVNELRRAVSELHAQGRPDIFRPGFCEALREQVNLMFDSPDADVIVACLDGTICGFAMVRYVNRPESPYLCALRFYHIDEFGVDEAFRRRGVGTALLAFCRAEAARLDFPRLELDVWSFNTAAQAFYEAAGFRPSRTFLELCP